MAELPLIHRREGITVAPTEQTIQDVAAEKERELTQPEVAPEEKAVVAPAEGDRITAPQPTAKPTEAITRPPAEVEAEAPPVTAPIPKEPVAEKAVPPPPNPMSQPVEYAKWLASTQAQLLALKLSKETEEHNTAVTQQNEAIAKLDSDQAAFDSKWAIYIRPSTRTESGKEFGGTDAQFAQYSKEANNLQTRATSLNANVDRLNTTAKQLDQQKTAIETTYFQKIPTGDLVPKMEYRFMPAAEKVELNKLGLQGFLDEKQRILERDYHKLDTGEYVALVDYTFWNNEMKKVANEQGLKALDTTGMTDEEIFEKNIEWGVIPERSIFVGTDKEGQIEYRPPIYNEKDIPSLWAKEKDFLRDSWVYMSEAIRAAGLKPPKRGRDQERKWFSEPKKAADQPEVFKSWWKDLSDDEKLAVLSHHSGPGKRAKELGKLLVSFVPVVGTAITWKDMNNTWRGISIAADILFVAPALRAITSGVTKAIKAKKGLPTVTTEQVGKMAASELKGYTKALKKAGYTDEAIKMEGSLAEGQIKVFDIRDSLKELNYRLANYPEAPPSGSSPVRFKQWREGKAQIRTQIKKAEDRLGDANTELSNAGFEYAKYTDKMARGEITLNKLQRGYLAELRKFKDLQDNVKPTAKWLREYNKSQEKLRTFHGMLKPKESFIVGEVFKGKIRGTNLLTDSPMTREQLKDFANSIVRHTNELYDEISVGVLKLSPVERSRMIERIRELDDLIRESIKDPSSGAPMKRSGLLQEQQTLRARIFASDTTGAILEEGSHTAAKAKEMRRLEEVLEELKLRRILAKTGDSPVAYRFKHTQAKPIKQLDLEIKSVIKKLHEMNTELQEGVWEHLKQSYYTIGRATPDADGLVGLVPDFGKRTGPYPNSPPGPKIGPTGGSSKPVIAVQERVGVTAIGRRPTISSLHPGSPISGQALKLIESQAEVAKKTPIGFRDFFPGAMFSFGVAGLRATVISSVGTEKQYDMSELQELVTMTPSEVQALTPQEIAVAQMAKLTESQLQKKISELNRADLERVTRLITEYNEALREGYRVGSAEFAKTGSLTGAMLKVQESVKPKTSPSIAAAIVTPLKTALKTPRKLKVKPPIAPPEIKKKVEPKKKIPSEFEGGVAFQMGELKAGKVFHILVSPYGEGDYKIYVGDKPPHGVTVVEDAEKAIETVQQLYGVTPRAKIDIGIVDVSVEPGVGDKPTLKFTGDPKQQTRQRYSAKRAKVHVEGKGESSIRRVR